MQKPFSGQPELFITSADLEHASLQGLDGAEAIFDSTLFAGSGSNLPNLYVINIRAPFSISRQTNNDHLINALHW